MGEKIRIELADWQFNAGILGLYNVLNHANDEVKLTNNYIEFEEEIFIDFEIKYFNYLIYSYEGITHWERLNKFYNNFKEHRKDEFDSFTSKNLDSLNKIIKELKNYLKRTNYKKVYSLIESDIDIEKEQKKLKQVKVSKKQEIGDLKDELKEQFSIIEDIYTYVYSDEGKKYLFAKTLIYNIINQSWENVSFLNRKPKYNDIYMEYKEDFVDKTIEYIKENKKEFNLSCFVTGLPIKNKATSYDMGFLVDTGFDTNRKTSHVWDFYNDIYICDLARIIYSCMPCGMFFTTGEDGIFINSNKSVEELIEVNNNVKQSIKNSLKEGITNRSLYIYKALVESMQKEVTSIINYELSDVQVIRKEKGKYRFNILSKETIGTIRDSKELLNSIIPAGYKEGKIYNYLYPVTVDRILNGVNMFTLIHKLLINKLTKSDSVTNYFNSYHIMCINKINLNFLKGVNALNNENEKNKLINDANRNGWYLGQEYKKMKNPEKAKGIAYRLLNGLKTRNAEDFLHNLLNSYMYVGKQVPKGLVEVLQDEEKLGVIGYAFVTGLVSSSLNEGDNRGKESSLNEEVK